MARFSKSSPAGSPPVIDVEWWPVEQTALARVEEVRPVVPPSPPVDVHPRRILARVTASGARCPVCREREATVTVLGGKLFKVRFCTRCAFVTQAASFMINRLFG